MNVAHHAAYVPWLEIARTELLRAGGLSYAELEHAGVFLVVVSLEVKYRRPVRYDDVVEVRTTVKGGSKVKIEHEYEVAVVERSGEPGFAREMAAVAKSTLACVDAKGKIAMLPAWMIGEG